VLSREILMYFQDRFFCTYYSINLTALGSSGVGSVPIHPVNYRSHWSTTSWRSYPLCKRGALLRILFEKRRIVHLSYIDTRRIREGSQSANNGTVDVL